MDCRNVLILMLIHQQISSAEIPTRTEPRSIRKYHSVVPSLFVGIPSLKVLAAQKINEMVRKGELAPEQLQLFSSKNNAQSSSPEETICNDTLQQNFSQMHISTAKQYVRDLNEGYVPRSGSSGRVAQKVLAKEIEIKLNRRY